MFREKSIAGVWTGLAAAMLAVGAFVRVPLYPVPLTLQTFFVFLLPMVFGPRISFYGILLYITLGLAGLPVFTSGGGIGSVLTPTFGYLIGFLLSAVPAGLICRKIPGIKGYVLSGIVSIFILNMAGVMGLYININFVQNREMLFTTAFTAGFLTFLIPEAIELAAAVLAAPVLLKIFGSVYKKRNGESTDAQIQ